LLEFGSEITFEDVARFPLLPLPSGSFPSFQNVLEKHGLWQNDSGSSGFEWRGRSDIEDLMVGFATPLTLPLYGDSYRALPLQLPVEVGDALVVAREWVDTPQTQDLISHLRTRLGTLAKATWGVEVLNDSLLGEHLPVALY
jgi:hypothetical protein